MVSLDRITRNGKCLLLAYDQGFEHGPTDFNEKNADPQYVFDIAKNSEAVTCVAVQKGIAEKYFTPNVHSSMSNIQLVIKLNGKTNYHKGEEMFSPQNCSVEYALKLGAAAVGYTIYFGSERENESFSEFGKIQEQAHAVGLPVIVWGYPRGKHIGPEGEHSPENVAYAARLALELGADAVKLAYTGNVDSMKWAVKCAGKTRVLVVGGSKTDEQTFLNKTREIVEAGALGWAVGRNVWQDDNPVEFVNKVGNVLFS